jgi:hypothetical protein
MRKTMATVLGLVLVVGLIGGCGSDDDDGGDAGGTTAPTTTEGDGGGSNDFSEIVAKAKSANIRIVYQRDGEDSITIAQNGEGKSAYTSGDSTIFTDGDTTVSCEGTGDDAECKEIPFGGAAASFLTTFTGLFTGLVNLPESVFGGEVSSDTIAGRDASCITFGAGDFSPLAALAGALDDAIDGEATICVDDETGFLLKLETDDGSSQKELFLATEVGEASESDVTPPVTPSKVTLPSISIPDISIPDVSIPDLPGITAPR